jgi:hypothetical protein
MARSHRLVGPAIATLVVAAWAQSTPVALAQEIAPPTGRIAWIEARERVHVLDLASGEDTVIFGIGPEAVYGIEAVSWRLDGGRLAFASGHEALCSVWQADLYLVDPDGTDLSRLTNGPACAALADLPAGTVRVDIENPGSDAADVLVHVQGLEVARQLTVPPATRVTVEVPDVRDLGDQEPQFVVVSRGGQRWFDAAVYADVAPGATADAGLLVLGTNAYDSWGALTVSWSDDGRRLAYQQGLGSLWQIDAAAPQLAVGRPLFAAEVNGEIAGTTPAWSPVDDRVLYQRYDTSPATIDVGTVDAERVGDPVVQVTLAHGLDWLPDGSGFIVSDSSEFLDTANLYQVELESGAVTAVTGYDTGYAIWPTVSPDGRFVAYGYTPVPLDAATSVELRVRHLASGADELLAANALNADWGP